MLDHSHTPFSGWKHSLSWNRVVDSMGTCETEAVTEHDFEKYLRQGFYYLFEEVPSMEER
jgi:hypothetical protein